MNLLFVDKPAGCTSHTSLGSNERHVWRDPNDGFKEMLEARRGLELFPVHRLDRETTGAMIFARDLQSAEELRAAFASRSIAKRYLFLTDRLIANTDFEVTSTISRDGKNYVSSSTDSPNARTRFRQLESSDGVALWEARPETGKSHQIRLHARDAGIPLLGDTLYGGSAFPALALHSAELRGSEYHHQSDPPFWFKDRSLLKDRQLIRWLAAIDRRERLCRSWDEAPTTLRWIHSEGDPLRAEQLGDVYSLSWFGEELPADQGSLQRLFELRGWKQHSLQLRGNRGRSPLAEATVIHDVPERWIAEESGLRFEFRRDTGLSPGLFLDQRQNRRWVQAHAKGKRVLNLFCYTGGFSVAAAAGGAQQVVSVDVSRPFLEWTRQNFTLNDLDLAKHEFRAMDSREYLKWARKKGLKFDLIICDPPSFGRSKAGVFKIEKDFGSLVGLCLDVLPPKGRLLASTNFENWTERDLCERLEMVAQSRKRRVVRTPSPDWDFELPREARNMKSFFVV